MLVSTQISKWLANTKMSQTNMQKVLSEALIHEFKPFVFSNTYLISTSQANPAKFDKIMATN